MDLLKEFFLEAFPNPEREGCPDEETLVALAENRLPPAHPARFHIGSCSECYAEYRGYCFEVQEKREPTFGTPKSEETRLAGSWSQTASVLGTNLKTPTKAALWVRDRILAAYHHFSRS